MQVIIYKDGGYTCVVIPRTDSGLTIEQIAQKDVPKDSAYRIVDSLEIPTDPAARAGWNPDMSSPDGYGVGHTEWFILNPPAGPPAPTE